jgi:hypothetical protein
VPVDLLECDAIIGCSLHKLRNVGRETHIYVHHLSSLHLVNTSLPTMTFFTQENELSDLDKYLLDAIDGVLDPSIYGLWEASHTLATEGQVAATEVHATSAGHPKTLRPR